MKKTLLTVVALLCLFIVSAQDIRFGVKAGINLSTIQYNVLDVMAGAAIVQEQSPSNALDVGFHIGGFAQITTYSKFAFQPELMYSSQGSKLEGTYSIMSEKTTLGSRTEIIANSTTTTALKTSYINMPLLVKFFPNKKFFIALGPQAGLLLSAKSTTDGTTTTTATTYSSGPTFVETNTIAINPTDNDVKYSFNNFNISGVAGLGFYATKNIMIEVRYNFGLTNDAKEQENAIVKPEARASAFQFSIGYRFVK
jgi:hypothetical protein